MVEEVAWRQRRTKLASVSEAVSLLLELRFRSLLLGFRSFLFGQWCQGKYFVELAR